MKMGPREIPKRGICASNLKQIFTALYEYSQNYNGVYPTVE